MKQDISRLNFLLPLAAVTANLLLAQSAFATQAAEPWPGAYTSEAFADGAIREVFCDILGLVEGQFGALLASAAGVTAIAYAAFGQRGHASSAIITAVGAASIAAGISLYFGDFGCSGGEQVARTVSAEVNEATNNSLLRAFSPQPQQQAAPDALEGEQTEKDPFQEM